MIPRIIHQTAKTTDIPEQWRGFQKTVRSIYPSWEYKLCGQIRARNLDLSLEMPLSGWRSIRTTQEHHAGGTIRYIILQLEGGLYLDLDYEVFRPFRSA